jgi:hypothetical protein
MEKSKIQENTQKLIEFVGRKFEAGELDNQSLVELFKHCGMYLNFETIPGYAKRTKMSYEGVKRFRKIEEIFGVKFVIDND